MDFSFLNSSRFPEKPSGQMTMPQFGSSAKPQMLAVSFVNFQQWEQPYDVPEALEKGTIFPSLSLPFEREGG